ncbi:MAG: hypothetical protein HY007_02225 [Candidatus Sungbacteria bacterium]|nr:hypothetical protein [Candidatus Sungbacteria bacterium]
METEEEFLEWLLALIVNCEKMYREHLDLEGDELKKKVCEVINRALSAKDNGVTH